MAGVLDRDGPRPVDKGPIDHTAADKSQQKGHEGGHDEEGRE